jgi:hypothetical protein
MAVGKGTKAVMAVNFSHSQLAAKLARGFRTTDSRSSALECGDFADVTSFLSEAYAPVS